MKIINLQPLELRVR